MLKKNYLVCAIFTAAIFLSGCASSPFTIVKENPFSPKLSGYQSIYVGWLDMQEDDWQLYGYDSKNTWATEIKKHNIEGLREYLKAQLPGRSITGAKSKLDAFAGKEDIFLKFKFDKINLKHNGFGGFDEIVTDVDFIEGKTGKTVYTASIVTNNGVFGPYGWKGATFDGRLDMGINHLALAVAEKLK
jgi:hypothetical protein